MTENITKYKFWQNYRNRLLAWTRNAILSIYCLLSILAVALMYNWGATSVTETNITTTHTILEELNHSVNYDSNHYVNLKWLLLIEPRHEKTCLCHIRTTKAHINLRIRAVKCSLPGWYNTSTCYSRNFKTLVCLWSWADRFESHLVANPEDRFSRDVAQLAYWNSNQWFQIRSAS